MTVRDENLVHALALQEVVGRGFGESSGQANLTAYTFLCLRCTLRLLQPHGSSPNCACQVLVDNSAFYLTSACTQGVQPRSHRARPTRDGRCLGTALLQLYALVERGSSNISIVTNDSHDRCMRTNCSPTDAQDMASCWSFLAVLHSHTLLLS